MKLTLDELIDWCAEEGRTIVITPQKAILFLDGECTGAELEKVTGAISHQGKQPVQTVATDADVAGIKTPVERALATRELIDAYHAHEQAR